MPTIRRTTKVSKEALDKFLNVNSPTSEIKSAISVAKTRFISMGKNHRTTLGKLIARSEGQDISPTLSLDITSSASALSSYINALSSFLKVELGARMKGKLRQEAMASIIKENIDELRKLYPSRDICLSAQVIRGDTIYLVIKAKNANEILIAITLTGICVERGAFSTPEEINKAIGGFSLV